MMPAMVDPAPGRRVLRPRRWLEALLQAANAVELATCRYHLRRGGFDNHRQVAGEHLLTFSEQGQLLAEVDGTDIRVGAGEALWISPGMVRRYHAAGGGGVLRYYNLRFRLTVGGRQAVFARETQTVRDAWELRPLLLQLYDLYHHGHPLAEPRRRGLLAAAASGFLALAREARSAPTGRTLSPAQRLRISRYVVDRIGEGLGPEDLAMEAGLSLDYFSRLFRGSYGTSPRKYLKRERVRLAGLQLLETGLSVAEIARQVGTDNVSLFCRQFKDVAGCTPGQYRRRQVPPLG
jgi:AraC family transcriptional regulator